MLLLVCCLLVVDSWLLVRGSLICWTLFVVLCLLFVVHSALCFFVVWCCLVFGVLVFGVWRLVFGVVVCCLFVVVCYVLLLVCCLLVVDSWLLVRGSLFLPLGF